MLEVQCQYEEHILLPSNIYIDLYLKHNECVTGVLVGQSVGGDISPSLCSPVTVPGLADGDN